MCRLVSCKSRVSCATLSTTAHVRLVRFSHCEKDYVYIIIRLFGIYSRSHEIEFVFDERNI